LEDCKTWAVKYAIDLDGAGATRGFAAGQPRVSAALVEADGAGRVADRRRVRAAP